MTCDKFIYTHTRHTQKHSHTSLQHQSSPLLAVPLSPPPPLPIPLHPLPLCLHPPRLHLLSPFPMIPSPNSEPVIPTHIPNAQFFQSHHPTYLQLPALHPCKYHFRWPVLIHVTAAARPFHIPCVRRCRSRARFRTRRRCFC